MGRDGRYFVNDTGKTIVELYEEAKRNWKAGFLPPLMTRLENVEYDRANEKWIKKRLATFRTIDGWLSDEDLIQLSPDEQIFDSEMYGDNRVKRLGDLRFYKLARKNAGLPPLPADVLTAKITSDRRKATLDAKRHKKESDAQVKKGKESLHSFLDTRR